MSDETWQDRIKDGWFYDIKSKDDLDTMLSYSPTNKIINNGLALWSTEITPIIHSFQGKHKKAYDDFLDLIEIQYMNINGEPREQAIRLRAEMARFEVKEEKKKGFLGLFGGKE